MNQIELFETLLKINKPWHIHDLDVDETRDVLTITVSTSETLFPCPFCNTMCPKYDTRPRQWRHLDTMEFQTYIKADLPRVRCSTHGIHQIHVPWAETLSRYTMKFECYVIDWLKEAPISAVAKLLGLSWNAIAGIMQRAVERGLKRRKKKRPKHISIDETSFQRRHEYVTVITDQTTGEVLHIGDNRTKETLAAYYKGIGESRCRSIQSISMDMWPAYITTTEEYVENAYRKICFDKFHVAQYLGNAVDKVRRSEHKQLHADDNDVLKGTKYYWLQNPENMDKETEEKFQVIRDSSLKTASAYAIKEHAMCLWKFASRQWAVKQWTLWYNWACDSALTPVIKAAQTIGNNLWGIINAIILQRSNAAAESMNSRIQRIKSRARGFRNRVRFKNVIYFHCGNLELYPSC